MPAESKKQQKFFGILKSIRDGTADPGKIDNYKELKEKADNLTVKQIDDFAGTKHKGLPNKKRKKRKKKKKSSLLSLESKALRINNLKSLLRQSKLENH